jgi:hypothetical protein
LDRIDIHVDAPRMPVQKLSPLDGGEASRTTQQARFALLNKPNVQVNGNMRAGRSAAVLSIG